MASVVSDFTCLCGGTVINEWFCRTGEESEYCKKCGAYTHVRRELDETGQPLIEITDDQQERFVLNMKRGGGFGTASLVGDAPYHGGIIFFDSKESLISFKEDIEGAVERGELSLDLDKSYIFAYNSETQTGEVVFGFGNPDEPNPSTTPLAEEPF